MSKTGGSIARRVENTDLYFGSAIPTSGDFMDNDTFLVTNDGTEIGEVIEIYKYDEQTGQWYNARLYDWGYLVSHWSVEPTLNTTLATGEVYDYILGGVTRYRFVPISYDPTQDGFYENFDGTTLSTLITNRG